MSAQDVQLKILEPMQRVLLPPRKMEAADEQAALRDYVETLQQFNSEDLSWAWGRVRETHATRSWPLPSAFYKAAAEARRERNERAGGGRSALNKGPTPADLWDRWKAVSRSPLAQEAVRRGVTWTLKCAILHDKKLPEQIDLREFTAQKESAARTAKKIESGEEIEFKGRTLPPFAGSNKDLALRMYRNVQMNETRTQQEINYGVPELEAAE